MSLLIRGRASAKKKKIRFAVGLVTQWPELAI